jgi:hypothetical protein
MNECTVVQKGLRKAADSIGSDALKTLRQTVTEETGAREQNSSWLSNGFFTSSDFHTAVTAEGKDWGRIKEERMA